MDVILFQLLTRFNIYNNYLYKYKIVLNKKSVANY